MYRLYANEDPKRRFPVENPALFSRSLSVKSNFRCSLRDIKRRVLRARQQKVTDSPRLRKNYMTGATLKQKWSFSSDDILATENSADSGSGGGSGEANAKKSEQVRKPVVNRFT